MNVMQIEMRPKKRIFLALILVSIVVLAGMFFLLWQLILPGLASLNTYLPIIVATIIGGGILVLTFAVLGMIFTLWGIKKFFVFQKPAWYSINMLFPIAVFIGKLLDINKEIIERSFIEVSNHLVKQNNIKIAPERLLILTPHCIQLDVCPHKITRDINNCKQCGRCPVGDLLALTRKYGVHLAVATGGTLARQVVKRIRPKAILAIACERDLTSGIQDVFPIPVIGVLNERPQGPCCNTIVDINKVELAIKNFLQTDGTDE